MIAPLTHFSLLQMTDPSHHRDENELQELFHRAELLAQPGVAWRDRWVRDPACTAASLIDHPDLEIHYVAMHWLRAPAHFSARAFSEHFQRATQRGLDSRLWAREVAHEYMTPLKGYVRREPLVSEQALPFRPLKGVFLIVSRFFRHHDADAEEVFRWYDQIRIPDMLDCPGAAGAWTFAQRHLFSPTRDLSMPALRIQLFYLDGDPVAFAEAVSGRETAWAAAGRARDTRHVEDVLFAGPLRSIVPWRWNWFDAASPVEARS